MTTAEGEVRSALMAPIDVVSRMTTLDPQMIDRLVKAKRFPAPAKLSYKVRRWVISQVEDWCRRQADDDFGHAS